MENFLQWIEKILEFLKNYGFLNIIKSCILIILFAFTVNIAFNPKETIKTIIEWIHVIEKEKHAAREEIPSDHHGQRQAYRYYPSGYQRSA